MAIQIQGSGGTVADVDGTTFRALRITPRPVNYGTLGIYRMGMRSGTMAAALAADAEMFQFRWPTGQTNLALVYKVNISAGANVAATAAAICSFCMVACRGWTGAGSGGTRATLTGNISKLRATMGTSLVNDAGISTTAGLTAGTKTPDHATTNMGQVAFGIGTGAITTALDLNFLPQSDLFNAMDDGLMPLVLVAEEGFIVRNGAVIFPAAMTWCFAVNVLWAEVAAF